MQRNPFPVKSAVMESTTIAGTAKTPVKTPRKSRSENIDPNVQVSLPLKKPISSSPSVPSSRSGKSKKKTPNDAAAAVLPPPINRRKFLIVRKNRKKCEDVEKYRQAAYEALHASHEDFFKNDVVLSSESKSQQPLLIQISPEKQPIPDIVEDEDDDEVEGVSVSGLVGSSKVKKMRRIVLEEARRSIPTAGTGQVKHLVSAFENMLSITKTTTGDGDGDRNYLEEKDKSINLLPLPSEEEDMKKIWPLPGIQLQTLSKTSSCRSSTEFSFPPKLSVNDFSSVFSSTDSSNASTRWSLETRLTTSKEGGSRRNSLEKASKRNTKLKVTKQNPFKLRTENRGRLKEEEFQRKLREMLNEEEKKRIPVAQRLPWTTDEPECLVKPAVKETSEPIDILLHSDVRAVERAEFDQYIEKRMELNEQRKVEIERQRKLEEEEMVRRLRKDAVPKAQPMPYFDRPFVPKRSSRQITVPKEPTFRTTYHRPHSHCKCLSEKRGGDF
ncbi:TPX2 (Targeting protein for Xklp2) family protein [Zostera marina]|uniref:TPX2 (Targeting protein for Xklp2) family protein n=1 Tax=Zostera marina TaxID=29655 RepID=A0A0K9PX98_ZOSMR|nr:TPX2 (Targeting protein for Xklp2) family protein [Zostera marina]